MKTRIRALIRQSETGLDVTFTAIGYIILMFIMLTMVHDFGRIAYVSSVSYNAARAAAQEAAKQVDVNAFLSGQEIVFNTQVNNAAWQKYDEMTNGVIPPLLPPFQVDTHNIRDGQKMVRIEVHTMVSFSTLNGFLSAYHGDSEPPTIIPPVELTVEAYAEPAFGINKETQ